MGREIEAYGVEFLGKPLHGRPVLDHRQLDLRCGGFPAEEVHLVGVAVLRGGGGMPDDRLGTAIDLLPVRLQAIESPRAGEILNGALVDMAVVQAQCEIAQ